MAPPSKGTEDFKTENERGSAFFLTAEEKKKGGEVVVLARSTARAYIYRYIFLPLYCGLVPFLCLVG